ncbi:sigma-70 family RNA polymerase sigma factor [Leptolyngbya sp. FACHB-541]|uniref:sigma-70 family RNA polymerase sigma factor n=1 Tax=Leptolyngbya sp. FACHB-541 TaxID=2692810 RepID=UPI0016846787|nr:sigma-70 family RNA polymerase sigma factor [Leptolyngbya sp. FACHB-541]MBD2001302.1 sigma-70 family RNA polymerase sigma factor [Leptolyngbya sp. FACHB-541]
MHPDSPKPEPSASDQTDADLFLALKAGRIEALSALYDRYSNLVYGLALRVLSNSEEAEDVTQEIFLALWHKDNYNPTRGSLSSFLVTMTRSRSIDRLRSRNTKLRFLQRWKRISTAEEISANPLEQVSINERSQLIREALARLPDSERQVLEIAYFEGLSQSEMSQRLGIPLGTVKTRTRQGLLKLKQHLRDFIQ